jgi:3-hydroxyacyl-[acyl-carrier-protein] dehydratase
MLKDSLYKIKSLAHQDNAIQAILEINEHHDILNGHFPGQPVLPGACMLQIVKEVLEDTLSSSFQLKIATNLKFTQLIDPHDNNLIELKLNYKLMKDKQFQVSTNLLSEETICFKFQGVFVLL